MKYCSKCGNQLLDQAIMCPKCGCPTECNKTPTPEKKKQSTGKVVGTILLIIASLILLYSFGILLGILL